MAALAHSPVALHDVTAEFRHPLVRALAWCIGSPSLFNPTLPAWCGHLASNTCGAHWFDAARPWLQVLEKNPAALEQLFPPESKRPLGKAFEMLIGFWLEQRADIAWVQASLLAKRSGRTMGEFDHIYADTSGAIHAQELTVKFYLRVAPHRGADGYVGPMVFDFMAQKIARMATHQMRLGETEDGQRAIKNCLERRAIAHDPTAEIPVVSHAIARGYLFEPRFAPPAVEPIEVGSHHLRGTWLTLDRMPEIPAAQMACWKPLDGLEWLGPQRVAPQRLMTLNQCAETMTKLRHVMVGRFVPDALDDAWVESERLMLLTHDARVLSVAQHDQ